MTDAAKSPYILGLDLGVQSVGWAVIDLGSDGQTCGIRRVGGRCFDSGVGSETKIASGEDASKNIDRRQARQTRRQLWRRGRRLKKVFHVLREAGLLPRDKTSSPEDRHELLKKLDAELTKTYLPDGDRVAAHLLPYRLRAAALDHPMPPYALGRALFHLAQRRGFETNSRNAAKNEKETGPVKKAIGKLEAKIAANARTLGEYFAGIDPEEQRIRGPEAWTSRKMHRDEFESIWTKQLPNHPYLDEWKTQIHSAIFDQRPLKSQKGLIGFCELEPDCRRAPVASLEAQRFRFLQKVNDLDIATPNGEIWQLSEPAHAEMRMKVIDLLEKRAKISFKNLRKELGLQKDRETGKDFRFNLEAVDKNLPSSTTAAKLRKTFGDDYLQKVDDIRICTPTGESWTLTNPEHANLRARLIELLENDKGSEPLKARLGLVKPQNSKKDYFLVIDVGGDGELHGNATAVKLRSTLGNEYQRFTQEQLNEIVDALLDYENPDALVRRLVERYKLSSEKALDLSNLDLAAGYVSFSRKAIQKLLPILEQGRRLGTLTQDEWQVLFPNRKHGGNMVDRLPPVMEAVPQLRNPVVCRGLTELRKVVNALLREYGKPAIIRVELARDLKRSRKQREIITEQNDVNKRSRDAARKKIARKLPCCHWALERIPPVGASKGTRERGFGVEG